MISLQAQARFNESSQKLDLLRYSLEQRLSELPQNHPKSSLISDELFMVATPQSPRQSIISSHNQYSTVAKPAALTGKHTLSQSDGHSCSSCSPKGESITQGEYFNQSCCPSHKNYEYWDTNSTVLFFLSQALEENVWFRCHYRNHIRTTNGSVDKAETKVKFSQWFWFEELNIFFLFPPVDPT